MKTYLYKMSMVAAFMAFTAIVTYVWILQSVEVAMFLSTHLCTCFRDIAIYLQDNAERLTVMSAVMWGAIGYLFVNKYIYVKKGV